MPQKVAEVATRYGRLRPVAYRWGKGWLCLCDCGKETIVSGGNLRAGNVVSCGCYRIEKCSETGINMNEKLKASGKPYGWDLYRLNRASGAPVRPMLTKRKKSDNAKPCWCCRRPTKNFICVKCSGGSSVKGNRGGDDSSEQAVRQTCYPEEPQVSVLDTWLREGL